MMGGGDLYGSLTRTWRGETRRFSLVPLEDVVLYIIERMWRPSEAVGV